MGKRIAAVPLWFLATLMMYGLVAYVIALPEYGGAALGAVAAALVYLDPTRSLWDQERSQR